MNDAIRSIEETGRGIDWGNLTSLSLSLFLSELDVSPKGIG